MSEKKAILVVSFGTSYHETCEKNIGAIERDVAAAYPDWEVRRAFTSGMIIRKLKRRDGLTVDTVGEALERLAAEGFGTVLCQPTHILNGEEFDDIVADAVPLAGRFRRFGIGAPLLSLTGDYRRVTAVISKAFPPQAGAVLCLMGHGSEHHHADAAYAALDYHFKVNGRPDIFVGTVEGYPDLDTMLEQVAAYAPERAVLTPLMVVAGDHAVNDLAGDGEDSWNTAFQRAGYKVDCVLKGLGEYPQIRRIYVDHVGDAIASLEEE